MEQMEQQRRIELIEESFTIPLWGKFSREVLLSEADKLGSDRAFQRGFHLKVYDEDEKTFPSFSNCKKLVEPKSVIEKDWPRFAGVDPFGKNIVIFIVALSPEGIRYPVDILTKIPRNHIIETLIEVRASYKVKMFVVENNAAQIFIEDGIKMKGGKDFPVTSKTTTGITKTIGFASLEIEFANDLWFWAAGEYAHEYVCECGWCVWAREMEDHPDTDTIDTIIACYYAREAIRAEGLETFQGYEEIVF